MLTSIILSFALLILPETHTLFPICIFIPLGISLRQPPSQARITSPPAPAPESVSASQLLVESVTLGNDFNVAEQGLARSILTISLESFRPGLARGIIVGGALSWRFSCPGSEKGEAVGKGFARAGAPAPVATAAVWVIDNEGNDCAWLGVGSPDMPGDAAVARCPYIALASTLAPPVPVLRVKLDPGPFVHHPASTIQKRGVISARSAGEKESELIDKGGVAQSILFGIAVIFRAGAAPW
ncbi:hypothetical protein GYMLUDRAFT_252530 [Collybiopsis luxurians FD-317 M1]|uniref:Uncharacterized protein n=1 Tax=Collybiopsis luxurians FD-317 M1 TaxID=944289 RepID=A0A0D0C820_9AGAR|nr:hypothetical protein GYMLUDRAFT_252530 [Collybiopsis luxurians FD-317 M1]